MAWTRTAAEVYRDGPTGASAYNPEKSEIRPLLMQYENAIDSLTIMLGASAGAVKALRSQLTAVAGDFELGDVGVVFADTDENNGIYAHNGTTFVRTSDLPGFAANAAAAAAEAWAGQAQVARDGAEDAAGIAAGYADAAVSQGNVPIYGTVAGLGALTIPGGITTIRLNGHTAAGDFGDQIRIVGVSSDPGAVQSADGRWWVVANDRIRLEMVGGLNDGGASDQAAWEIAKALGRPVDLVEGKSYLLTDPLNNGLPVSGRGKLVVDIGGGEQKQISTYADNDMAFGREYLAAAYERILVDQASSGGVLGVIVAGNSWVAGGSGEAPDDIVTVMSRTLGDNGVVNVSFTNIGVGGTTWSDLNILPSLSTDNKLAIITYVVNEAPGGLAAMATAARAKLGGIRADADGSLDKLSIILVIPGSTYDHPNSRDERWYEQVFALYRQLAREYSCALFDGYRFFRDSSQAAGFWMDDPYSDGRAIHPLQLMSGPFWSRIIDEFFPRSSLLTAATNRHINRGANTGVPAVTVQPDQYDYGIMQIRVTPGAGWPQDGQLINIRSADEPTIQMLHSYDTSAANFMTRIALPGWATWSPWTGQKNNITFTNGWVPFLTGWDSVIRSASGTVTVNFTIKNGTTTSGTVVATLPPGFRPAHEIVCLGTVAGSAGAQIIEFRVEIDGDILGYGLNAGASSLSVTFPAA